MTTPKRTARVMRGLTEMATLVDRLGPQAIEPKVRGSRRWQDIMRAIDWIHECQVHDGLTIECDS